MAAHDNHRADVVSDSTAADPTSHSPSGAGELPMEDFTIGGRTRIEHDSLGNRTVPADAYYGVHTTRALTNFAISGTRIGDLPELVTALACVKQACAETNRELGLLPNDKASAIIGACLDIRQGRLHDQFVVDPIQGGAGTSTNMNANEVIANRGLELMGRERGDYVALHPLDHVNASQSTNDVYPTALKIALYIAIGRLLGSMNELQEAFEDKATGFARVLKIGRTQLQDAVPMTLGQEFEAYAVTLGEDQERLGEAAKLLCEINMGATAIGTGINTDPRYAQLVCNHLSRITGIDLVTAPHLVEATSDTGVFVQLSGVLKRIAVKLSKICNDLRLLSSGPTAGLGEINLPAVQAGSSIMPGKVNPVIPELVNQIAFRVVGNDVTVTFAAEGGQLQLNAFEPIILACLMESLRFLREGCSTLNTRCVQGITANADHLRRVVEGSVGLITALTPYIGYENASAVAADALATHRSIAELVLERNLLTPKELKSLLFPENLVRPIATSPHGADPPGHRGRARRVRPRGCTPRRTAFREIPSRLGPRAVARVGPVAAGRVVLVGAQVLADLRLQGGLEHSLGQPGQQPRPGQRVFLADADDRAHLQRAARRQLADEGEPVTRLSVARRAVRFIEHEELGVYPSGELPPQATPTGALTVTPRPFACGEKQPVGVEPFNLVTSTGGHASADDARMSKLEVEQGG